MRHVKKGLFNVLASLALISGGSCYAQQLTGGTYNVPSQISSIAAAINGLNAAAAAGTFTSSVIINVATGWTETAPAGGYVLTASGTQFKTITIQKVGPPTNANPLIIAAYTGTATPASAIQDGVFTLVGSDYVTIDGIDILDNNTSNPATMDYGYGAFRKDASDGAQYNTIKNCNITLNRINSTAETNSLGEGSRGIWFATVNYTAQATAMVVATSASGNNSYNTFQNNTIQNVNEGIGVFGFFNYTAPNLTSGLVDVGNQIIGNSITNFGGGATQSAHGIKTRGQSGIIIANNFINSNNNHNGFLAGIENGTAPSATVSITGNTISLGIQTTVTSGNRIGINNLGGATASNNAINIDNNVIQNTTVMGSSTYIFYGIYNNAANSASLSISGNLLSNLTTTFTSVTSANANMYPIYNTGAVTQVIAINSNTTSNLTAGYYDYGIYNTGGVAATTTTNINYNVGTNIIANYDSRFVYNTGASYNMSISNNAVTGFTVTNLYSTAAYVYGLIYNTAAATNAINVNNNSFVKVKGYSVIYGIYTSGASVRKNVNNNLADNWDPTSTLYGFYILGTSSGGLSVSSNTIQNCNVNSITTEYWLYLSGNASPNYTVNNNVWKNISRVNLTNTADAYFYYCTGYPASGVGYINNNTLTNLDNGAGNLYGLYRGVSTTTGHTVNINNNYVTNITNRASIYGIYHGFASLSSISNNTLTAISSSVAAALSSAIYVGVGSSSGTVNIGNNIISALYNQNQNSFGIRTTADNGYLQNIYANKIYNVSSATYTAAGIYHTGRGNIYNNIIGGIFTTNGLGPEFEGIRISGGTGAYPVNIYHNTVRLNASNQGGLSAALVVAPIPPAAVQVNNNIFINTSTGTGGKACIYWGSTVYTNFSTTSNNNLFFVGTPASNNPIFYDGTNAYYTLLQYQTALSPRDANSITENNTPFLSTTGVNTNYLHIDPNSITLAESAGVSGLSVVTDIDGDIRAGQPGYTGSGTAPDIGADEFNANVPLCSGVITGSAVATATNLCSGTSSAITPSAYPQILNLTYEWKSATSPSGPWASMSPTSAVPSSVNSATAVGTYYYYLEASCLDPLNGNTTSSSNTVQINVNVSPSASVAVINSATVCVGQSFTLQGSSDMSAPDYLWTGPNGFTATSQDVIFNNTQAIQEGLYSVITSSSGCSSSVADINITVIELPALPVSNTTLISLCSGVSTATIEAFGLVPCSGGWNTNVNNPGTGTYGVNNVGLVFTATSNFVLTSVDIVTGTAIGGILSIQLQDNTGVPLQTATFVITAANTLMTLNLNFNVTAGSSYRLVQNGGTAIAIVRPTTGQSWPYALCNVGSITGGWLAGSASTTYYYFFNWQVTVGSGVVSWYNAAVGGNLLAANATSLETVGTSVMPTAVAGTYTFFAETDNGSCASASRVPIVVNVAPVQGTLNTIPSSCNGANNGSFTFTPGACGIAPFTYSVDGIAAAAPPSNLAPGNHTVIVVAANSATSFPYVINITEPLPVAAPYINSSNLITACTGAASATVSATANGNISVFNENFNGATNGWTTFGSLTGTTVGAPATSADWYWTLVPSGYVPSFYAAAVNSNDNSQYYISNADGGGSTSAVSDVILQSPAINTSGLGLASLTLNFYHFFQFYNTGAFPDIASVDVSTNGTTWTTVQAYTANQGAATAFALATVNLNAYIGNPTLYIRFHYNTNWGYGWAIDNVSLVGTTSSQAATGIQWYTIPTGGIPIATSNTLQMVGTSVLPSPAVAGTYSFYAQGIYNSSTCVSPAPRTLVQVVVNPIPSVNATVSSPSVCSAVVVSITASGASSYTWSGSVTGSGSLVTVSTTTAGGTSVQTRIVTGATAGCSNSATVTWNVLAPPVITLTAPPTTTTAANTSSLCLGSSINLNASGANTYTYTWTGGSFVGASPAAISPTSGVTVSAIGKDAVTGCNSLAKTWSLTVYSPALNVAVTPTQICSGVTTTLSATGGTNYSWNNGNSVWTNTAATTASVVLTTDLPLSTTVYSITGTETHGCAGTKTVQVTVVNGANVAISPVSPSICAGQITPLNASGAVSYTWLPTGLNASTQYISLSSDATYTVIGSIPGCAQTSSATVDISVYQVSGAISPNVLCYGETATLTAMSGAASYTWYGSAPGATTVVTPNVTGDYYLMGTTPSGCTTYTSTHVVVNPVPVLTFVSNPICPGGTGVIQVFGANTYTWASNGSNSNQFADSPIGVAGDTFSYSVVGSSTAGCLSSGIGYIQLLSASQVTFGTQSSTVCPGGSATISIIGQALDINTINWSDGSINTLSIVVSPAVSTQYTVSGLISGCPNTQSTTANAGIWSAPTVTANSGAVCLNNTYVFTPTIAPSGSSGQTTYSITDGVGTQVTSALNTAMSLPLPVGVNSFSVIAKDLHGCITPAQALMTVTVNPLPVVSALSSHTICSSYPNIFTPSLTAASAANGYSLFAGSTLAASGSPTMSVTQTAAGTYTYYVRGRDVNGCVSSNTVATSLSVTASPTLQTNAATMNGTICPGSTFTFDATSLGILSYTVNGTAVTTATNTASNTFTFGASPTAGTYNYTVSGTDATGCVSPASGIAVAHLTVYPNPGMTVSNATICSNNTATLTVGGSNMTSGQYIITDLFSGSVTTQAATTYTSAPLITTSISVAGISQYGCVSSNTVVGTVSVNTTPTLSAADHTICVGQTATITAAANPVTVVTTYSINGGLLPPNLGGNNWAVYPAQNTPYQITGKGLGNCPAFNTVVVTVNVNQSPVISAPSIGEICVGDSYDINASGADTYSLLPLGGIPGTVVSPLATTVYSVIGFTSLGCVSMNTVHVAVMVNELPEIDATTPTSIICAASGAPVTLLVGGANTYTWSTGDNSMIITVNNPGTTTTYSVWGTDINGCVNNGMVTVYIDPCTGIAENLGGDLIFGIYPNPNNGDFTVEAAENTHIVVMNAVGQMVYEQTTTTAKTEVSINTLANGIYFVKAISGSQQQIVKVIKQN